MNFTALNLNNREQSLSLQLKEILEDKIRNKELKTGEKLPSQLELRKIFKVSNDTVTSALGSLIKEGYISRRQRYGTVIISSEPNREADFQRKREIAVVNCLTELSGAEHIQNIISGIEGKAKEKGIYLLNSTLRSDEDISFLLNKQKDIAGLIVLDTITSKNYRSIKKMKIPFVLIGDILDRQHKEPEVDIIVNDDFRVAYFAAKHLVDIGHRRIAYIAHSFKKYSWEKEKLKGYKQALKEAGIGFDNNLVTEVGSYNISETPEVLRKLMESVPFTALICEQQGVFLEATKVLKEDGRNIPENISVFGIGCKGVTNVSYDSKDIGKVAFKQLLERLTNPGWKPGRIIVPFKFSDLGTTKRLKAGVKNLTGI